MPDILTAARALVASPAQWARQTARHGDRYCVVGAIWWAMGCPDSKTLKPAVDALARGLRRPGFAVRVAAWNDDPETTHREVLATFDRAIAMAREAATICERNGE